MAKSTKDIKLKDTKPMSIPGETKEAAPPSPAVVPDSNIYFDTSPTAGSKINYGKTYTKKDYEQSQSVIDAYNALQQHNANKPGEYNSRWQNTIDNVINKILNREKFSYDLNGDALYHQYKDQYTTQGKLAMMNTMGQAAAMTGGYGSSYSQAAGQQAYQGYLQQLNEVVPQLYQMAYDRYNQEGQDMYSQYSMLSAQDQAEYGKYRDEVSDYYTDRDYLTGVYNSERDFDYGKYQFDTTFAYQAEQDAIRNQQWEKEYELKEQSHELDKMKFESTEEQRAWENLMVETEYNDSKKSEEQKNAENLALKWLSMGIMPESSVLEAAGISAEAAESMVGAVNAEKNSSIESENRSYAYDTTMKMLASGVMPSAELLAQAGISIEDATTIMNAYKEKEKLLASNTSSKDSLSVSEWNSIYSKAESVAEDGPEALGRYLDMLVGNGYIEQTDADQIMEQLYTEEDDKVIDPPLVEHEVPGSITPDTPQGEPTIVVDPEMAKGTLKSAEDLALDMVLAGGKYTPPILEDEEKKKKSSLPNKLTNNELR
jgi:hypothetical protein